MANCRHFASHWTTSWTTHHQANCHRHLVDYPPPPRYGSKRLSVELTLSGAATSASPFSLFFQLLAAYSLVGPPPSHSHGGCGRLVDHWTLWARGAGARSTFFLVNHCALPVSYPTNFSIMCSAGQSQKLKCRPSDNKAPVLIISLPASWKMDEMNSHITPNQSIPIPNCVLPVSRSTSQTIC